MRRRSILKGAGAVAIVVAGGSVWRAFDVGLLGQGDGRAYEPWKTWRQDANEGPLTLVRAAILAANATNTQPWLFRVTSASIELHADLRRNIGAFDPYLRELHISMGCALENLMLAAAANGYQASATLLPGTLAPVADKLGAQMVARVELAPGNRVPTELYRAIPLRHTNRYPFDLGKQVPSDFVSALRTLTSEETQVKIVLFTSQAERDAMADMILKAYADQSSYVDVRAGVARWIREDQAAVDKSCDGIAIDDLGLPPLTSAVAKFLPLAVIRRNGANQLKGAYPKLLRSAQLFGLIAVRDRYDREQSVRAGRIWQRAHLLATACGLAARPANQAAQLVDNQKFAGQEAREAAILGKLAGGPPWQPTFMFYMGYPTHEARVSARRPVQDVLL